jgi:hypothetical protein
MEGYAVEMVKSSFTLSNMMKQQALWFIQLEKERVLHNYHNGTTTIDQTVGSLNTLFQIASYIKDLECMKNIWQSIMNVRTGTFKQIQSNDHKSNII